MIHVSRLQVDIIGDAKMLHRWHNHKAIALRMMDHVAYSSEDQERILGAEPYKTMVSWMKGRPDEPEPTDGGDGEDKGEGDTEDESGESSSSQEASAGADVADVVTVKRLCDPAEAQSSTERSSKKPKTENVSRSPLLVAQRLILLHFSERSRGLAQVKSLTLQGRGPGGKSAYFHNKPSTDHSGYSPRTACI